MGSVFKKPKAPAPSATQRQLEKTQLETQRQQLETRREQESEIAERAAKTKASRKGRRSLLTGAATGTDEKSATLG